MEKYKEYKGVWFYNTDRGHVRITWTTSYEHTENMSKTFINEESAIKYIDDNDISDYVNNNRVISEMISKKISEKNNNKN